MTFVGFDLHQRYITACEHAALRRTVAKELRRGAAGRWLPS